jgi:ADP-ribosylation factor-like protein 6
MGGGASSATSADVAKPHSKKNMFGITKRADCRILVVGLDNSGKTTVIAWLKATSGKAASAKAAGAAVPLEVVPTVGFQLEEFARGAFNFKVFDMSGQSRYRELWGSYFREAQGVLFVVDASDRLRMAVAKDELRLVLLHEHVAHRVDGLPFAFLANKMDLGGAVDSVELAALLGVNEGFAHPWLMVPTCANTGEGIEQALTWLTEKVAASNGS